MQREDLFAEVKAQSIAKASALLRELKLEALDLKEAIKLSALGNVIDYGSASEFCIGDFDFLQAWRDLKFACFEFKEFKRELERAKSFVMLGDNAGENLFDEMFLRLLRRDFAELEIYYFVRGAPIINDLTFFDLEKFESCKGMFEVAKVIDSGVRTPGFVYEDATPMAREIFDSADLVLSKGMGNFECLEERRNEKIFFLLKIKCQVVARLLKMPLGEMVLKRNL